MSNQDKDSAFHKAASTGQQMVDSDWLDVHFEASRPEYESMLYAAGIQSGWTVLDAGTGSGSFLPLLSDLVGENGKLCAIDLAIENVEIVQKQLITQKLSCPTEMRQGSITEIPFEDNTFDAIWCANTFQYLTKDELEGALAEFQRVVKPGGLVVVKEFDATALYFGPFDPILIWHLFEALQGSELQLGAGALFTVDLRHYFTEAGLTNVRFKTFVGDHQHPLRPAEIEFLKSALRHYASLAEQAGLPEAEVEIWRKKIKDSNGSDHILKRPDFYFRETHGLVTGNVAA